MSRHVMFAGFVSVALAGGCVAPPAAYPEPPPETYTAAMLPVGIDGETTPLAGARVDRPFFEAARVAPLLGRMLTEPDFAGDAAPAALVGEALWRTRLQASPEIIGRTIDLDGQATVVVGILPRGFTHPDGAQVWIPRRRPGGGR